MVVFIKKHWIFVICFFIFLLFLARNPFSSRTLIPNFEPYPDAIHYVAPARNFVINNQFAIVREGRVMTPRVPPLYSLFLIPFYMINNDARFFYFGNVFLALFSFFLFYLIIKKLTTNNQPFDSSQGKQPITGYLIIFFSLFLYITNYFNYWYPTLAMSENLTIFLFLINIYILIKPLNKITTIVGGALPFAFFITKYAHTTLTGVFLLFYAIKLITEIGWKNKKKLKKWALHFGISVIVTIFLLLYFELIPGISTLFEYIKILLPKTQGSTQVLNSTGGWFSLIYMEEYLPKYIRALFGGYSVRFLWDNTPIVPLYIGIPGMLGLILGVFSRKTRLLAVTLLLSLISSVLFMSTFYSLDMRYLYQVIPAILIGFVMFWTILYRKLETLNPKSYSNPKLLKSKKKPSLEFGISNLFRVLSLGFKFLLVAFICFYMATNLIRFKKQIMLNLKYAERPWYYLSVLKLNDYFKSYPKDKPVPVVISSLIPYYVDFYSNGNYSLLPLSLHQEFRNNRVEAWGDFDYADLIKLYYKVLLSGHELYIHNYGLGNEKVLHDDFKKIQENFIMTKVSEGCYGACDIWKLKMKWGIDWIYNKKSE